MKGLFSSLKQMAVESVTQDEGDQQERDSSRGEKRDIFLFPVGQSKDPQKIIWSIPPVYPFDTEYYKENSGFIF